MNIRVHVTVFWTEEGYRARADELGMISECRPRRASAVKNLKDMLRAYMKDLAEHGKLTKELDAVGYLWPIGKDFIHVDPADSLQITLTLPKDQRSAAREREEAHAIDSPSVSLSDLPPWISVLRQLQAAHGRAHTAAALPQLRQAAAR